MEIELVFDGVAIAVGFHHLHARPPKEAVGLDSYGIVPLGNEEVHVPKLLRC